jgi:hypothetical protein
MSPIPGKPVENMEKVSALNKINSIEIGPQSRKEKFNLHLSDFHSAQRWRYYFGSTCLCGSNFGYSFPSTGATHRFPSSADPIRRCDFRMRWFVVARSEASGCLDLHFASHHRHSNRPRAGSSTAHSDSSTTPVGQPKMDWRG